MPQAEKLKLKAESKMVEKEVASPMLADHKILIRQIHEAYMKNFNMNKAKARLILTGKTSKPVKERKEVNTLHSVSSPSNILSSVFFVFFPPAAFHHPRHGDVPAGREDVSGPYGER